MSVWEQTVREYHAHVAAVKCRATADSYRAGVKHWVAFLDERGIVDLADTGEALLDDFVVWVLDHGISPATLKSRLVGVDTYLEYLRRRGHTVPRYGRPALPRVWAKDPRVLTIDELREYFEASNEVPEPVRTILLLFPLNGLRSDEMVRIRLDSVAMMDGWVVFRFLGKGKKPREVPLLKQGNQLLRSYLTGWRESWVDKTNEWLFPGHLRGTHISTRSVRKWADWVSTQIGIPELSPHTLRKTYSTMLDAMGVSPFKNAQLMGHSSIRTTKQTYVKHAFNALVSDLSKVQIPTIRAAG